MYFSNLLNKLQLLASINFAENRIINVAFVNK